MSEEWLSREKEEQTTAEFRYLSSIDPQTGNWRGLGRMYFNPKVLDKFRNNIRCKVESNYIIFLAPRRDDDLTINFELIDDRLMVQSKCYCFVRPKERKHWQEYQLPVDEKTSPNRKLK
ncbi:hypothetical protein BH18THE1_BH18THE1_10550 [soil metagenome]